MRHTLPLLFLFLLACGDDSSSPVTPTPPMPQPAAWRLTFDDVDVGIESIIPPMIFVEPTLRLEETAGTAYYVDFIRFEVRVVQVPEYLQVREMGADDVAREFGSNRFQGNTTQTFEPHYPLTLTPDGDLSLVFIFGVTDELGNSKELRVERVGDVATLRELRRLLTESAGSP